MENQNRNKGDIFNYETGKYTNEDKSSSKNKKIEEIIKKEKINTLKFEEELDNSSFFEKHKKLKINIDKHPFVSYYINIA